MHREAICGVGATTSNSRTGSVLLAAEVSTQATKPLGGASPHTGSTSPTPEASAARATQWAALTSRRRRRRPRRWTRARSGRGRSGSLSHASARLISAAITEAIVCVPYQCDADFRRKRFLSSHDTFTVTRMCQSYVSISLIHLQPGQKSMSLSLKRADKESPMK